MKLFRFIKNIFKLLRKELPEFSDFTIFGLKQIGIYAGFFSGLYFVGKCVEWSGFKHLVPLTPDGNYPGAFVTGIFAMTLIVIITLFIFAAHQIWINVKKIWNETV